MKNNESLSEKALEKVNAGCINLLDLSMGLQSKTDNPSSSGIPQAIPNSNMSSMETTGIPTLESGVLNSLQENASSCIPPVTSPLLKSQSDLLTKPGAVSQNQSNPLKKKIP